MKYYTFKVKGLGGDYPDGYQIEPFNPCKQCRCAVVFSKVLSDPLYFLNFMKYYFIT